jgi:peptidoglycan DL-endopeptidase CwlO
VARQQLAAQRKVAARLKSHKDAIERALAAQRQLLASLQAAERRRLAAIEATRAAAEQTAAVHAQATAPTYTGPASGRAAVAVHFAYDQLGKPYQWGASGPSSYDCSGLTMAAWGAAGVSLPHSSAAQYGSGPHVSSADLEPGDLVFFGSPIHHVGIYIGHSDMINAPQTGDVVKVEYVFRSDYVGAVRP